MGTRKGTSSRSFIFRAMIALFFAIVLFVTPLLSVFTSIFTDNGDGDSNGSRKGSIPGTEVLAAAGWDEADFLVSGDTITGLSAEGISELSVDPDMKIPASFTTKVSPDTPVTKIAANAFTNYADSSTPINSVDIPSGFTDIGASAFQNSGLTAITLPATLITIDNQAFMGNTIATFDFTTLTALTTLGDGAFRENLLTSLTLPSNITKVGRYAFMNNKLTSVTLPNVTEIGEKAFANNKLAAVTLPGMTIDTTASTGIIHATAFDQNGKVVKVTVTDNDPAINSHFSGGSGFIINPVTITVTPLDYNDGASPHDPVGSPFVIGNDLTSDDLFERGTTTTVNAPVYTGYTAVDENTGAPASAQTLNNIGTNPADPDHESVTFYYKAANEKPTITANDRYITQSSAHTQAEILSWASAVAADGTTIPTSTNSAAVPGLVIESITIGSTYYGNEITTSMSETAGTVINITYKATDSLGNEARKTIKVTADSDPMQAYIPKADGTLSAWQYRDFTYVNETVTVSVLKYPSTTASPSYYTETVTGVTVTGFSAYGNAKYEGTTYSGVNYASVKAAAQANLVLPGINPSTGQAVVAISSTGAGGGTKFNTKKTNAPGAIDLSNMSALEIIGNDAFSSGDSTTTGSTPAYGDINFGNSGARLTKLRAIGDSAFRWNKVVNLDLSGLTALVIIGDYAFSDSSGNKVADAGGHALQSIDFSNLPALLAIGDWYDAGGRTFMNSQLRSIDLSGAPNLEQIGVAIFCSAAPNNVTITIPAFPLDLSMLDKLKIIGQHAFRDYPISELNISGMESLERIDGQNFGHLGSATLEIKDDPKLSVISPLVFNVSILTRTPFATSSVQTLIIDNCDSLVELHIALGGSSWATGDHGFEDLPLTSLVITNNDSLTTLSAPANTIKTSTATTPYFQDMNLTSITIDNNDSLTTIPYRAFYNSQSTTLVIANNDALVTIDQEAFTKNHAATLDLSTNPMLTTIGKNAFSQNNLASLPTGDGGSYLTSLNLNGLTHLDTIGNEAFANSKLTGTLDFTSNTALKNIGTRAFRSSAITDVAFPPSIELIGIMAFAYYSGDSLVLADLPNLKILSAGAFGQYNTEGSPAPLQTLELRNLPSLVNLNRADASYNGTPVEAGDYLAAATKETAYCATPGPDGIFGTGDDVTQGTAIVGGNFGNSLPNLTTLTIDNVGLYGLPPKAFYASPLTSLTIRNMPNLTNIGLYGDKTIPNEVTYNGMSYGTTDISGADQGAVANYGAFESALLTQLTLDNLPNLEVIGNESFKKSPLESLTLTNLPQLQVIGERSFQNAKYLTDLDLSNLPSLEIIGDNAFEQAPIETLNLQGDIALKKICYEAFYKNRLTTVDLSNLTSLEIIGSRAFSDGSAPGTAGGGGAAITSLILSNTPSLKIIGSVDGGSLGDDYKKATYYLCGEGCRTFYGASLTSLDLSGCPNLESVGYASFMNSPIEELDFTGLNKLQYIGMLSFGAFAGTQITISDLPELYEIGGLAFSSGRVTSNLTEITIENLPKLTYLSEQQAFKYDSDGNRINDFQGYNTTHYSLPWGSGTGFDTGNQAKRAYNKLTSLTLKNLPELNNIPPYIFFASPLTSLTLEDLGIYAIGYNAFQNAQVSALDLSNGLTNLATIDYQAFRNVPITQLDVLNLPNLKRIFPEAFLYSSLTYLDLSDTTDFIGFPTYVDIAGVYHKSAFGDVDDNSNGSQLGFVIIGGISPENTTDNLYAENYVYQGTTSQASLVPPTKTIINDADMAFVDQTFNKNNYVPVYISGDTGDVVTQDGYNLNPINVKVNYVYIGDGESDTGPDPTDTATYPGGENDPQYISDLAAWRAAQPDTIPNRMLRPEAVVRSQYDKVTHSVSLIAPQIAGYKLVASNQSPITVGDITFPSEENLADPDWVEPGNEFTFYYEKDTTSVNAVYTLTESGVKVYDEIGKLLETSWSLTNGSNDPNLAIGAGWSVQLTYDPLRVQFMGASSSNSYTYTNDSLAGVVTFTFTRDLPAGTLSPTCFWQLIPGRTEMDREFPIYASLITPSHTVTQAESDTIGGAYEGMAVGTVIPGRPVVEADPVTYLKGMYRTPDFTKFARPIAKKATTKQPVFPTSTDDVATFEGGWDPDEKQFNNYDNFTMVYTFKAGQNRAFKRNISGITYTDTLPIYYVNSELYLGHTGNGANGTEVQAIAAFDPAKNPGWEVTEAYDLGADGLYGTSDDGRTYIYVEDPDGDPDTADGPLAYYVVSPARQDIYDEDNDGDTTETIPEVRSYYPNPTDLTPTKVSYTYDKLCTMTPPSATLYLDFPYAWEDQEFTNSANFTAPIYRAAYGDLTEFSGADSIKSLIVGVPPGNFVKEADKPHSTADVENGTDGLNVVPASPSVAAGELDDVYGEQHPAIAPEPITDNAVDGAVISDYQGWFYDSSVDKNQSDVEGEGEQRWYITLSGKDSDGVDFADGSYFKDVAFTDTLYDSRLRFKAISVNDFKPATVTAYDAAGNVLYSKSGVTGRVNFPNNIRDDIAKVTVTDSKVTVRSGEVKGIYVYTELRDPSITWEGITGGTSVAHNDGTEYAGGVYDPISRTADDYFWNLGEANRTLVTTTTDSDTGVTTIEEYKQHVDSFDSIRIHNLTEGLGIEKWSSVASGSSFIAGDPVDYTIKINTFDAGTLKEISCDQVDMELDNVVIIDVLPSVYIDYKFTPSAKLLLAATDGPDADDDAYTYEFISDGYTDDAGKTYNILKITIDHLDVSALYTSSYLKDVAGNSVPQSGVVGKISGKIDESAGATTVVNRVFMDYDPQPGSVINIGKGTESYTPEAQIANPNDDPNDPNDNFIPNPDYNPNDAISAGIIDGYNPFHTTPTPGDTSDDIIVGTDVGITGVTRQLIAQKSIQTTTSYTGTYPNGKHNYGGWKTTPPSKNGEAVTLAGVNTGGVAQQWAYDFQYRLRVTNNTDQAIEENDFEILDILPRRNDHTIIPDGDGVWAERYSEFENEVVSVETPVYYDAADTTHSNPYHYTVKFLVGDDAIPADLGDIAQRSGGNLIGTPDGIKDASDVEYWYLNPPAGYTWYTGVLSASSTSTKDIYELIDAATYAGVTIDPAKVLAIRIKGSPNIRVLENSSLDVIVNMHAPDEGEDQGGPAVGARAINNFVWKCNTQAAYLEVPSVYNEIPPFPASVHVKKTSAGSNAALAGAKFGIYDTGGDTDVLVQVKTSNATGDITFTNLMPGSYVIKEIEAPKGYALNTDSWEVTVQTKSVAWDYYVSAVPYSDGSSAAGAVSPSSAPAGMAPVTNTPLPTSISLQKVGLNEAGDTVVGPLSGAKFGLYSDLACTTLIAEQTTNSGGFAFWDGLMPGTYYVKEISAPTGFVPDTTTVYTVVVTEGATHVESIQIDGNTSTTAIDAIRNAADQRHVVRGNLTLKKLDGVDGDALAGATFKITRVALTEYSDFLVSKTNPVDLTKLKTASEYKAYTTTVTTDANGEIILTDLLTLDTTIANLTNNYDSLGGVVYTIEETVAPGKLEKIKLQVVVYKDYCMVVPGSVMYYDTAQAAWTPVTNAGLTESDVADDNGSTALTPYIEIDITNPLAPVTISKLGLDINNTTAIAKDPTQLRSNDGTPLSGVTFEIWEKGGGALGADLQIGGTYTTNNAGLITVRDLKVGTVYLLKETSIPQYYQDATNEVTVFKLDALGNVLGFTGGGIDDNDDTEDDDWAPYTTGNVMVKNIPLPVPAQLIIDKKVTYPDDGVKGDTGVGVTSQPFSTTEALGGIKFYIEKLNYGPNGVMDTLAGPDMIIGTDDDTNTNDDYWEAYAVIVTSDGTVSYTDTKGTLNPADDVTGTLPEGRAYLGGLYEGWYRIKEQPVSEAPINGKYLAQTVTRTFNVKTTSEFIGAATTFTYTGTTGFMNYEVEPIMVKGDYVGTFDPNDSYEQKQLATAYKLLDDAGENPHEMIRNDGKIDLVSGLGGAVFVMKEHADPTSAAASNVTGAWIITSKPDGTFDFANAATYYLSGPDGVLDENHGGEPGVTSTDDVMPWYPGPDGILDTTHGGSGTSSDDVQDPPFTGFNSERSYSFQEILAVPGYDLNTTITYYYPQYEANGIRKNGGKWISLENRVTKHSITVSKYATDTNDSLAGTTFALYYPDGTQVMTDAAAKAYATFTTDADGILELTNIAPGTYYLKEVSAPFSLGANGVYDSLAGPDGIEQTADDILRGDDTAYEVKTGYYKIVIDGSKDVGGPAPESAHQTDKISPFTQGASATDTGDPATYHYDGTDTLNTNYTGPNAAGRSSAYDEYTNAYNYIYSPVIMTSAEAYPVVYDRRLADRFTLTIAKRTAGEAPADQYYYFRVEFSDDDGATWSLYEDGRPYILYQSDTDDMGIDMFVSDYGTTGTDLIRLKANEHATISAGLEENTLYRVTEVDEDGNPLDGWYANVRKTWSENPSGIVWYPGIDGILDASHGGASGNISYDDEIDIEMDAATLYDPSGIPQDRVTGKLDVLETHGDNLTTDPDGDNDEGHHVVEYRNQKSVDFEFEKLGLNADGGTYLLPGVEFTVYRCKVIADCDDSVTDYDDHVAGTHGDFGSSDSCWEPYFIVTSDEYGRVYIRDLVLYGDSKTDNDLNTVEPFCDTYILAETGTPVGFNVPFGYWVLTIDPSQDDPEDQIQITAGTTTGMLPPAFALDDFDEDPSTPDSYQLTNRRASQYPMTGGANHAPLFLLLGAIIASFGILFAGFGKKPLAVVKKSSEKLNKLKHALISSSTLRVGFLFIGGALLWTIMTLCVLSADTEPDTGSITIIKYVGEETENRANGKEITGNDAFFADTENYKPIEGISFKATRVTASSTAADSDVLITDLNEIKYIADSANALEKTATTNADGKALFSDLPLGDYLITELADERVKTAVEPFLIKIPTTLTTGTTGNMVTEILYDITVYPKNELVEDTTPTPTDENPPDTKPPDDNNPSDDNKPPDNPSGNGGTGTGGTTGTSGTKKVKTGDNSNLYLFIGVGAVSLLAIIILIIVALRKRRRKPRAPAGKMGSARDPNDTGKPPDLEGGDAI